MQHSKPNDKAKAYRSVYDERQKKLLTYDKGVNKVIELQQSDFQHVQLAVEHEGIVYLRLLCRLWKAVLSAELLC